MMRHWLSCELADCVSSIFLAAVPFLVNIIVPIPPSYPGGHVEAECSACAVQPVDTFFMLQYYNYITNSTTLPTQAKDFQTRPTSPKNSGNGIVSSKSYWAVSDFKLLPQQWQRKINLENILVRQYNPGLLPSVYQGKLK
jgi:hypothetical protein